MNDNTSMKIFRKYIIVYQILFVSIESVSGSSAWAPDIELRGLWLSTVNNMDWPSAPALPVSQAQDQLRHYLDLMVKINLNCVFFHVRPAGDAFYKSELEPWSVYLTGKQGQPPIPLWDPLSYVVTEAHKRGIQVHAWINPYRARDGSNSSLGLDVHNMALRFPQYAYPYCSWLWMDPGATVVRDFILSVVDDILKRYKVDGIHIDDYYYPYHACGLTFPDKLTYEKYRKQGGTLSLPDWRRDNINTFVRMLGQLVRSHNRVFSVSPTGFYRTGTHGGQPSPLAGLDPYTKLFADTKLWLEKGWMDWFIPQIYWPIKPPVHSFPLILDWWLDVSHNSSNKHIFSGIGLFKTMPPNNWNPEEIVHQIEISRNATRRTKGSLGNVHFSAKYLRDNHKHIVEVYKAFYPNHALVPNSTLNNAPNSS